MITLEQVKIIREKKYFTNNPGDKKPKGILRNIGDYIRKTGADPMRGDYGSETKDFGKADKTKPLYRGGQTSQGMQTTQGIKKGSIPEPKDVSKLSTKKITTDRILPPSGSTMTVQKNLLTGKDDIKIKSKRGRKPGSINKPKVDKTPGQLDLFNQPKGVKQSDISKTQKKFTQEINKANKNRKEFEYAKSKESKTFKGTVTQGADKGRNYTITRNPPPKGIDKNLNKAEVKLRDAKSGRNMKTGRLDPISQDLAKRAARGEPKAVQFTIDMRKDYRRGRGLGKRGERKIDASGGKKTGSLRKGNLSFPGDRTGAYSRTKTQIDFDKALSKARGGTKGDIAPEAPKSVKDYAQSVRDKRIKKLGTPDPFEVDTSKAAKQSRKAFGTPTKSQIKKLSKTKIGGYRAPKGDFGKGLTPGEFRGKQMDVKAFKKTTTKDILTDPKLSKQYGVKSFQKFSRDLQDFKDRDMPGGPRKTTTTKPKTSDVTLSRQDVGMAPPDTPKRTPRVKQILRKKADEMGGSKYMKRMKPYLDTTKKQRDTLAKKPNRTPETTKQIRTYNRILKGKQLPDEVALAAIPKKSNTPPPLDPPPNNSSRKTFKQMQRDLRGKDGKVTYNFTDRPAAKLTRGFKGQLGKRAFVGKVAKGLAKRPGLTGALTIAGLYGANELRKAFFGPKAPKREKIKITPPKGYSKFSDIPQNKRTETDKELMNVGRSSISPAALKQMGKGGRYDPGKGFNLKKYSQSDAYKDTLRQIRAKTGKKNLDPYGVMGNKK